jgi:NTF2 fold immunity protein
VTRRLVDNKEELVKHGLLLLCTLLVASSAAGQEFKPKDGFVPDKIAATEIAEAVLVPVYGKQVIESEKPLIAELKDEAWTVRGTMPSGWHGGVAVVKISKTHGRILSMVHYQ